MDFLQKEKEGIAQNLFVQLQQIQPIIFQEKLQIQAPSTNFCNSSFQGHNNGGCRGERSGQRERELLFEKIVTPSDVGKLNRLVIPKQFAEKYFPLDSSTNDKGLFLNFEDRNGQQWRFRYSYWKSSQSFVMTRGWSRFVKDKKLHAGDVVSFERYVAEMGKNSFHFRIDWKHRSDIVLRQRDLYFHGQSPKFNLPNLGFDSFHHLNPLSVSSQRSMAVVEPVTQTRHCRSSEAKPKRLRLFGVNLDCPEEPKRHTYSRFESSSSSSLSPNETPLLQTETQFSSRGKASAFFPFHWNP